VQFRRGVFSILHKKALIPRLFPVDLDAPYRDLERTFILRAIKNIEI